jgi:hypothetical protein
MNIGIESYVRSVLCGACLLMGTLPCVSGAQNSQVLPTEATKVFVAEFADSGSNARTLKVGSIFTGALWLEAFRIHGVEAIHVASQTAMCVPRAESADTPALRMAPGDYKVYGEVASDSSAVRVRYTIVKCGLYGLRTVFAGDTASFAWSEASAGLSAVAAYVIRKVSNDMAQILIQIAPITYQFPRSPVSMTSTLLQPALIVRAVISQQADSLGYRILSQTNQADYRIRINVGYADGPAIRLIILTDRLYGTIHTDTLTERVDTTMLDERTVEIGRRVISRIRDEAVRFGRVRNEAISTPGASATPSTVPPLERGAHSSGQQLQPGRLNLGVPLTALPLRPRERTCTQFKDAPAWAEACPWRRGRGSPG